MAECGGMGGGVAWGGRGGGGAGACGAGAGGGSGEEGESGGMDCGWMGVVGGGCDGFDGVEDEKVREEWEKAVAALCLVLVVDAREQAKLAS